MAPTPASGRPHRRPASPHPEVDTRRYRAAGLATSIVAALIAVVGVIVANGVFRVSLFGADESGVGGGASTVAYAFAAFACGLVASELMLLLLRTTPTPLTYYGWIVGLVTTVATVVPLTMGSDFGARVAIALTNACIGTAIGALTVSATRRSITYTPPSEPDLGPPYI